MNMMDKERAYGKIPASFDRMLEHALDAPAKRVQRPRMAVALVALILLLALGVTAVAIVNQWGLFELLYTVDKEREAEVRSLVTDQIPQKGGMGDMATVVLREAVYDGRTVHLLYAVEPAKEGHALVDIHHSRADFLYEEAEAFGPELISVHMEVDIDGKVLGSMQTMCNRDEAGLVYVTQYILPDERQNSDALSVQTTFTLYEGKTEDVMETLVLDSTLDKTGDAQVYTHDVNIAHDVVDIQTVTISHTPIETIVSMQLKPKLRSFNDIWWIPDDGQVNVMRHSSFVERNREDGTEIRQYQFEAAGGMPETISFWITGTHDAYAVDVQTGEVTHRLVNTERDDEQIVTLTEEERE